MSGRQGERGAGPDDPLVDPRMAWPSERFVDETLSEVGPDEGASDPAAPRDERERAFVVQQRLAHGLLRALHQDAESREQRVRRILERVRARGGGEAGNDEVAAAGAHGAGEHIPAGGLAAAVPVEARPPRLLRRVPAPLAAAVLLATALVVFVVVRGPRRLPQAQALPAAEEVLETLGDRLRADVDRAYSIRIETVLLRRPETRSVFSGELIARGGGSFTFDGRAPSGRRIELVSDGRTVWFRSGRLNWSQPLEDSPRIVERLGFFLDVGQLQLDDLVARLPRTCRLRTTDRLPPAEPGGPSLLRLEASGLPRFRRGGVDSAVLLVEESSRMVHKIATRMRGPGGAGQLRVTITYHGEVEPEDGRYRRGF